MKRFYILAIAAMSLMLIPSCKPEEEEVVLDVTVENVSGYWVEKECIINGQTYNSEGSSTYDFKADGSFHYTNTESECDGSWEVKGAVLSTSYPDATGVIHAEYNVDKLTNRTLILSQEGGASTTYKRK